MLSSPLPAASPEVVYLAAANPAQVLAPNRRHPVCGLGYIAYRLGKEDMRVPSLIHYIRRLITLSGFPAPMNPRIYRGQSLTGAAGVCISARWYQLVVDTWFDGLVPPQDLHLIHDADEATAAEILDARAAAIGAGE